MRKRHFHTPFLSALLALLPFWASAQSTFTITEELEWTGDDFKNAHHSADESGVPVFMKRMPLPSGGRLSAVITSLEVSAMEGSGLQMANIQDDFKIQTFVEWERHRPYCRIMVTPLRRQNGMVERLDRFELLLTLIPQPLPGSGLRENTYTSVLSDGDIYKISVSENGVHRISSEFLSGLGVDVSDLDPRTIRIYGNGGGRMPGSLEIERYDDLEENAIFISGEADGSFDGNDYILFYAEGPGKRQYDEGSQTYSIEPNPYDNHNYYFIKIGSGNGRRISNTPNLNGTEYTTDQFDDFRHLEDERYNLLHDHVYNHGSGTEWYGDRFELTTQRTYDFNFPNIDMNSPVKLAAGIVARRDGSSSKFSVRVNDQHFESETILPVNTTKPEAIYARRGNVSETFLPSSASLPVTVTYNAPGGTAWLDYITINARRDLVYEGGQMTFRDIQSANHASTTFQLDGVDGNTVVWDITDPLKPRRQESGLSGGQLSFGTETGTIKQFIAFDAEGEFPSPESIGAIPNQNLHAITGVDALVVYHRDFEAAVDAFIAHRSAYSGITLAKAEISDIYNEFSSGSQDPVAIRDMAKMLYERTTDFRYLLLFGDGSFDYRDAYGIPTKSNFIPVYETAESLYPIRAFPCDDYYALLSDSEGGDLQGALDIGVGRFTVTTLAEANTVVQKIIRYDTNPSTLGNWRNSVTFVADDEDGGRHLFDAENINGTVEVGYPNINLNKIYFDAYQQVASAGGDTYPSATAAINSSIFKGQLIMNYLGHGGPTSWAQERVLQEVDINSWQNTDKMPLFVTATCTFTPYDDASIVSAGEKVFLRENGGSIALLSTARVVFSGANERLTQSVFEHVFDLVDGEYITLGDLQRRSKNSNALDTLQDNARKFALVGDPTMHLAIPEHIVKTSTINGLAVSDADTIAALQEVTVTGIVTDKNGNLLPNFNGTVYPTVFDKPQAVSTLGNDSGSPVINFDSQKSILFKGAASVTNGQFSFTFVVPSDINYLYGQGKISYYADDGVSRDAAGHYEGVVIGGTAEDAVADDTPPLVKVFMDDEQFAFGGTTSPDPVLYIKLSDDFGINVAGTGIGHDLTAVLDDNDRDVIILNDFYEATVDDFRKGEVRYPLSGIEPGRHTVRVKGWDIANNSGEGYTEFVVADDAEVALAHVLNYPNPFTTSTEFQFEHNMAGQSLRVQVQIFTVSGKLVKTITEDVFAQGSRLTGIGWDGRDDYGDKLARGVYLYKVTVGHFDSEAIGKSTSSDFEKLVILK